MVPMLNCELRFRESGVVVNWLNSRSLPCSISDRTPTAIMTLVIEARPKIVYISIGKRLDPPRLAAAARHAPTPKPISAVPTYLTQQSQAKWL
jgi:hypothetical protein